MTKDDRIKLIAQLAAKIYANASENGWKMAVSIAIKIVEEAEKSSGQKGKRKGDLITG